jgi:hypothetical protein
MNLYPVGNVTEDPPYRLEKLNVSHLVKNILLSYGTRKFITMFTKAHH